MPMHSFSIVHVLHNLLDARHRSLKLDGFMNLKQFDDSEMDLFRIWGWKVTGIKTEWV